MVKRGKLFAGVVCWVILGWLIHAAAPTLNGVKWGALPLGFWLAAQGAPLMLLGLAWFMIPQPGVSADED